MSGDDPVQPIFGILSTAIIALLAFTVLDGIIQLNLAPKPGDPLYPAFARNIDIARTALVLAVGGVGTVGAYLISQIRGF
jgi:hypothetical protein